VDPSTIVLLSLFRFRGLAIEAETGFVFYPVELIDSRQSTKMLKNHLLIALRNLRKHSFYTILNVLGLSLGIACSLILFLFIRYHFGFDRYHREAGQIYRVVTDLHLDDGSVKYESGAPMALATAIKAEVPQVKNLSFLFSNFRDLSFTVSTAGPANASGKLFAEHGNIAFADRHWFDLFDYKWLAGDPHTALQAPDEAILTSSQARKYFGDADPIGKTISINGRANIKITGLLKDPVGQTDKRIAVFISLSSLKAFYPEQQPSMETGWGWINSSNSLFLLLPEGLRPQVVDKAMKGLARKYMGEMAKYYDFHTQPLKDVHFDIRYGGVIPRSQLTTLGIIGLLILTIACVNFINLATAQNARRTKEVCTRKILGSTQSGIFWQFIIETACITGMAIILSLCIVFPVLPFLNQWLNTALVLHPLHDPLLIKVLLLLMVFIIPAAGFYPAVMLSRFKPAGMLQSKSGRIRQTGLRKALILLQNLVAQALIICTLIITMQTHFLKTADLGFNKESVVMIPVPKPDKSDLTFLRNRLLAQPDIKDASFCFRPPASEVFKAGSIRFDQREWESYAALGILGDSHYLSTFGLRLIAGRNFAESDSIREFLVNEEMVKKLGFTNPAQVLGHQLVAGALNDHPGTIVGVVRNFHLHSLRSYMEPLLITTSREDYEHAGIKISGANPGKSIAEIRRIWQSVYPGNVFEYHFLDDQIANFYKKEMLLNKLTGIFAVIAIIISCMGLLGLISLLTIQRTKEIGIRKVIGASVANIAILLSKDFAGLAAIALVMATAITWFIMNNWLHGFAYGIHIPWWVFPLAGACNLGLAVLTISYHAIKAAMANPVESLRSE
jgi:putative ABC transport system permease protein